MEDEAVALIDLEHPGIVCGAGAPASGGQRVVVKGERLQQDVIRVDGVLNVLFGPEGKLVFRIVNAENTVETVLFVLDDGGTEVGVVGGAHDDRCTVDIDFTVHGLVIGGQRHANIFAVKPTTIDAYQAVGVFLG